VKDDFQASQRHTDLPVSRSQLIQRLRFGGVGLLRPIQGKAIQGCRVVLGATHPEEVTLPTFEGVLEESKEDSTSDPRKAHPETFPLLFYFLKVEKNIH